MKRITALAILLIGAACFLPTILTAETLYVDDQNSVTLHTGPDPQNRIVAVMGSGQALEVLSRQGGWTKVRLGPGKEGWVISRYLSDALPKSLLYDEARKALAAEKARAGALEQKNRDLALANDALSKSLADAQNRLAQSKAAYDALAVDSARAVELRKDLDRAREDVARLSKEAFAARKLVDEARKYQPLKWFSAGAGVILIGIILGMMIKGRQRRSRF